MLKRLSDWVRGRPPELPEPEPKPELPPPATPPIPFVRGRAREDGFDHLTRNHTAKATEAYRSSTGPPAKPQPGGGIAAEEKPKATISARIYRDRTKEWTDVGVLWTGEIEDLPEEIREILLAAKKQREG